MLGSSGGYIHKDGDASVVEFRDRPTNCRTDLRASRKAAMERAVLMIKMGKTPAERLGKEGNPMRKEGVLHEIKADGSFGEEEEVEREVGSREKGRKCKEKAWGARSAMASGASCTEEQKRKQTMVII